MNWADKLFKEIFNAKGYEFDVVAVDDLVLAVLEKEKEIVKEVMAYDMSGDIEDPLQASAFRELVKKCKEVKTNE